VIAGAIIDPVTEVFVKSLAKNFEEALTALEHALIDCPDELWATDLWPDEQAMEPAPGGGLVGSAPWFLAYHALSVLDYDLTADFEPYVPPQPFDENTWSFPNRMFTKPELLGWIELCRALVRETLDSLTNEMALRPLPNTHRYAGTPFGVIVGSLPLHTLEHATQIRQFIRAAGVKPQPASIREPGSSTDL
jgi:hypothetical protein